MIKSKTDEFNITLREKALNVALQKLPKSESNLYSQNTGFIDVKELIMDAKEIEKYLSEEIN